MLNSKLSMVARIPWPALVTNVAILLAPWAASALRVDVPPTQTSERLSYPTLAVKTSTTAPWIIAVLVCMFASVITVCGFALQKKGSAGPSSKYYQVFSITLSPLWILGFVLVAVATFPCDLLAYSLAPLSLTAPLSGLTVVVNQVVTPFILTEKLQYWPDVPASALVVLGIIATTSAGEHQEQKDITLSRLLQMAQDHVFVGNLLVLVTVVWMCLARIYWKRWTSFSISSVFDVAMPAMVAAGAGGLTNILLKALGELLKTGASWKQCLCCSALCGLPALMQLNFVSMGLQHYPQTLFVPVYSALLVLTNTYYGAVFYQEYLSLVIDVRRGALFCFGVSLIVSGLGLFMSRAPEKQKPDLGTTTAGEQWHVVKAKIPSHGGKPACLSDTPSSDNVPVVPPPVDDTPQIDALHSARDVHVSSDGKVSIGLAQERARIGELATLMPRIFDAAGCEPSSEIWGVRLSDESVERSSVLASFLRAREWRVKDAEAFLVEALAWRRENAIGEVRRNASADGPSWPDDIIRTVPRREADGQPHTYVVLSLGQLSGEMLARLDEFVMWRVRMQEKVCAQFGAAAATGSRWITAPRGPVYTLVLDTAGVQHYHIGPSMRAAFDKLKPVFTRYYPDFVEQTIVVNAPTLVKMTWPVVSKLLPTWWNARLGTLKELEQAERLERKHTEAAAVGVPAVATPRG